MADVIIYSTGSCPYCLRAKEWLAARGIGFTEFDVGKESARAKEMAEINPRGSVPTILINGRVVVGFVPEMMEDALRRQKLPKREEITQNIVFDPFER